MQDDNNQNDWNNPAAPPADLTMPQTSDMTMGTPVVGDMGASDAGATAPADSAPADFDPTNLDTTAAQESAAATSDLTLPTSGDPVDTTQELAEVASDVASDMPATPALTTDPALGTVSNGSLDNLKQQAIGNLTPLLSHLDQTPEDRFRTTMMMVQATDNKDLLPTAYEAANSIEDEKVKAQALLDVINEVNYFTQHDQHPELH